MLLTSRSVSSRRHCYGVALAFALCAWISQGRAADASGRPVGAISPVVLTNFEQIWRAADAEPQVRHPVRIEYVVYYYDPLWKAMWGRSGDAESYLSLGSKVFPIAPGQRILIEGSMVPSQGMTVDEPTVTILASEVPIEVRSTRGEIADVDKFNKRMVTVEGYVDQQSVRDANHMEIRLVVESRAVTAQLLLKADEAAPNLKGQFVRIRGVYFARNDSAGTKLEIWVQNQQNIEALGPLDRDRRFALSVTPVGQLAKVPPGKPVHLAGAVRAQAPGHSITLRDDTGEVVVATAQTRPIEFGAAVDIVGTPAFENGAWTLRDALYRPPQKVITAIDDLYVLPESEAQDVHRVRLEVVVHFFDPYWKVLWARSGPSDGYISLAGPTPPLKPGQRVLIEGTVVPIRGMIVDNPQITILGENVPVEALSVGSDVGNTERFNKHVVIVDGYVDRQLQTDPNHVELDVVADDRLISVRLLISDEVPQLEGTRIEAKGVYSATSDPAGGTPKIELWVQGKDQLVTHGRLDRDERFNIPATPIDQLGSVSGNVRVRVVGTVRAQQPGFSLTLRDDTGQMTVRSAQSARLGLGEAVEAIGFPVRQGSEWILQHSLFRSWAMAGSPANGELRLRLTEQLRDLSPAEAARRHVVQLTGVVTWTNPNADFFYVRDVSGGAYVVQPPGNPAPLLVGLKVEVTGVSSVGDFTPIVLATHVRYTANVDLPEARPITLEQALTGVEEAQWVSMGGYVRSVARDGPWARLELTTSAGEFAALLPPAAPLENLPGSVIRVRGVCSAVTNRRHQLTGIRIWVPSFDYVEIEEPVPADPFAVALRPVASFRQFSSLQASNRRVRVAGTVLSQVPGRSIHLLDGTDGLLVLSRGTGALHPGDRIEAVGFPGRESGRVVLREAIYRKIGPGQEPRPQRIADLAVIDPELDGHLVRVEARLLSVGGQEKEARLTAQANAVVFPAVLDLEKTALPAIWEVGSRVALTGVYEIQFDENKRPHSVQLQLRSVDDVLVLSRPSWWTGRRMLAVIGLFAMGSVLGLGWVVALRRRVRQQTDQIREQLEKEKAARLEAALARASKLESLGVLAGGIAHDFNNLLTVVMCNLSLARLQSRLDSDTERCLRESERATSRARDLTLQLLTFAKGGAPVRASTMLPEIVRESAQFALHGAKTRCEFEVDPDLWPANVDKGQIGQVVQNIVLNGNQAMADGGVIRVTLRNAENSGGAIPALPPGRYVKLTISDSGTGIPAEQLSRIFDPYFTTKQHGTGLGLATVYSIVKQHQGHVEVASTVGHGSTFTVWLPAAEAPPPLPTSPTVVLPRRTGRVLFMDDEPSIRQMACAVLSRMGLDVTAVSDGKEVVHEYTMARSAGQRYDVVILDLTVPGGMGGAEAMQKLRQIDPRVRAIVSSGYSSDPVMANYRAHGFVAVVAKPYEAADLAQAVDQVLPPAAAAVGTD